MVGFILRLNWIVLLRNKVYKNKNLKTGEHWKLGVQVQKWQNTKGTHSFIGLTPRTKLGWDVFGFNNSTHLKIICILSFGHSSSGLSIFYENKPWIYIQKLLGLNTLHKRKNGLADFLVLFLIEPFHMKKLQQKALSWFF